MDARAWLVWVLLLGPWDQRSHHLRSTSLALEGESSISEVPLSHEKTAEMAQSNPDVHLIRSKPSVPVKPYSLSLSPDDYHHYLPKPKRLRAPRLMKLLGSSYDPFWMSLEDPRGWNTSLKDLGTLSRDLLDRSVRFRKKLLQEAEGLDLPGLLPLEDGFPGNLSQTFIHHLHQWLVDSATCHLTSSWVDLGPIFWPRWLKSSAVQLGLRVKKESSELETSYNEKTGSDGTCGETCRSLQLGAEVKLGESLPYLLKEREENGLLWETEVPTSRS
ncbi:hypothetical protein lerEdw1_019554 [Lerista edwardsae]|nr:hypothetical protein lerEdw1_019554 [Lerista edwardsae]